MFRYPLPFLCTARSEQIFATPAFFLSAHPLSSSLCAFPLFPLRHAWRCAKGTFMSETTRFEEEKGDLAFSRPKESDRFFFLFLKSFLVAMRFVEQLCLVVFFPPYSWVVTPSSMPPVFDRSALPYPRQSAARLLYFSCRCTLSQGKYVVKKLLFFPGQLSSFVNMICPEFSCGDDRCRRPIADFSFSGTFFFSPTHSDVGWL